MSARPLTSAYDAVSEPRVDIPDTVVVDGLVPSISANPAYDALPEPRVDIPQPAKTVVGADLVSARPLTPTYDALPEPIRDTLQAVARELGTHTTLDFGAFATTLDRVAKQRGVRLTATLRKQIRDAVTSRDESAVPIVKRRVYDVVEYEPDPELRDTEQIPLLEPGGVAGFIEREVWPHVPDAWVLPGSERIGYEISFTRHFYRPKPLRTLAEIEADIRALERETDGLLDSILVNVEA